MQVAAAASAAAHATAATVQKVKQFEDQTHALRTTAEVGGKARIVLYTSHAHVFDPDPRGWCKIIGLSSFSCWKGSP